MDKVMDGAGEKVPTKKMSGEAKPVEQTKS